MNAHSLDTFQHSLNDTQVRILDAAIKCFTKWGVEKTRLSDVAKEAGVTRTTVYNHFSSLDAILRTAILTSASSFLHRILALFNEDDLPSQRLKKTFCFVLETFPKEPYLNFVLSSTMQQRLNLDIFNDVDSTAFITRAFDAIFSGYDLTGYNLSACIEMTMRLLLSLLTINGQFNASAHRVEEFIDNQLLPAVGLSPSQEAALSRIV